MMKQKCFLYCFVSWLALIFVFALPTELLANGKRPPPGWEKGKKEGWQGQECPRGLKKKAEFPGKGKGLEKRKQKK